MPATKEMMGKLVQTEIWIGGRIFYAGSDPSDTPNVNERDYAVWGKKDRLSDSETSDGTFRIRALTTDGDLEMQHMLRGYNPDRFQTGLIIEPDNGTMVPLWENIRKPDDSSYWKAKYFGAWTPSPIGNENGGETDISLMEFSGRTDYRRDFVNAWIYGDKVALASGSAGYSGTTTPVLKPVGSDDYALDVFGISGSGNGPLKVMQFSRGGSLVSASGAVVITANDYKEVPSTWAGLTSAFVVKLHTGSGTQFKNNLPVTTDSLWA